MNYLKSLHFRARYYASNHLAGGVTEGTPRRGVWRNWHAEAIKKLAEEKPKPKLQRKLTGYGSVLLPAIVSEGTAETFSFRRSGRVILDPLQAVGHAVIDHVAAAKLYGNFKARARVSTELDEPDRDLAYLLGLEAIEDFR